MSESAPLIQQLLRLIEKMRFPQAITDKLICNSFAILMEASLRDAKFWSALKNLTELDKLVSTLLLHESRQPIRKGIAQNVAIICGVSNSQKRANRPVSEDAPASTEREDPVGVDMLTAMWGALAESFPETLAWSYQSQEFFEVALAIFRSVADKAPQCLAFNNYLRDWSNIMLYHQIDEVGSFLP